MVLRRPQMNSVGQAGLAGSALRKAPPSAPVQRIA